MRLERRLEPSRTARLIMPVIAVLMGVVVGGVVIQAGGSDALEAYGVMFRSAFGSPDGWQSTLNQATPLILTGLAVALPARMGLWNIGGEGQLTVGAVAATGIGLFIPLPGVLLPLAMLLGAAAAGGAWALIAAVPRATRGVNEVITTLFLNYIAIQLMTYLVNGPWGDRSAIGFAYSRAIPDRAILPALTSTLTVGILISLAVAAVASWVSNRTPSGFTARLIGAGHQVSHYLRLPVTRLVISGFVAAGATAGLAGAIQVMGVTLRLEPGISSSYGYIGILVAFLAAGSIAGVVVAAILYGALIVGGLALQGSGVSSDISMVVQALIVLSLLGGQVAVGYGITFRTPTRGQEGRKAEVDQAEKLEDPSRRIDKNE